MRNSFSPLRNDILLRVQKANSPISADEIYTSMNSESALSTVYRALWFLQEKGMIEEIPVSCGDTCGKRNYFVSTDKEHCHFFHCEKCHAFIQVPGCTAESMSRTIEKKLGALVNRHVLYFTGVCAQCQGK